MSDTNRRADAKRRVHTLFNPRSIAPAPDAAAWRVTLYSVIFETSTPVGRAFDLALLWLIVASVVSVSLESVASINADYGPALSAFDWFVAAVFTVEYIARLVAVSRPIAYARSSGLYK